MVKKQPEKAFRNCQTILEAYEQVIESGKPKKLKIYVKGYKEKKFEMVDSASQPKGLICRVSLVMEKGRIVRVSFKNPKYIYDIRYIYINL